jgi:hypothetical protein
MATISEELQAVVEQLSPDEQRAVLEYARRLSQLRQYLLSLPLTPLPPGKPGSVLLDLNLNITREDAESTL